MPKPTCQLNLTLDVPTAEWVERIAREANLRPSGAGKSASRAEVETRERGVGIEDSELAEILNGVAALNDRDREAVRSIIKKAAA